MGTAFFKPVYLFAVGSSFNTGLLQQPLGHYSTSQKKRQHSVLTLMSTQRYWSQCKVGYAGNAVRIGDVPLLMVHV
jgi:hypothetical protein